MERGPDSQASGALGESARVLSPRPLFWPTVAFIGGIAFADRWGGIGSYAGVLLGAAAALLGAAGVLAGVSRCDRRVLLGVLVVGAFLAGAGRLAQSRKLAADHVGWVVSEEGVLSRLAGVVVNEPVSRAAEKRNPCLPYAPRPRTRFALAVREARVGAGPSEVSGLVQVTVAAEGIDVRPGDGVVVTGRLYRPRGPRNPGEFDWALWHRRQNVHAAMFVEDIALVRRLADETGSSGELEEDTPEGGRAILGRQIAKVLTRVRAAARGWLFAPFAGADEEDSISLLDAMVLGQRSAPGPALNEAFLKTGAIHFLTVSGFHVGVLGWAVWVLVRRGLRRGERVTAAVTAAMLVVYALIAEPNAPVFRATIMGLLFCAARVSGRDFASQNWLPAAALVLLLVDPQQLFRVGFQLSFLQMAVLIAFFVPLYSWRPWENADEGGRARDADSYRAFVVGLVGRWVWGLIVVSVLAWMAAWPLVVFHFQRFAPWAPLQALVISPLVVLTILLGFAAVVLGAIPWVGAAVGWCLRWVTELLMGSVDWLGGLPGALVEMAAPPAMTVVATYALALVALVAFRRWRRRSGDDRGAWSRSRAAWFGAAGVALLAIPCAWVGPRVLGAAAGVAGLRVCVLDVGNGSAAVVQCGGETLVVDAGTLGNFDVGETVFRALRAFGQRGAVQIAISHANFDHYSGVPTLLERADVDEVRVSPYFVAEGSADNECAPARLLERVRVAGGGTRVVSRGDVLALGDGRVEVLWPPTEGADELRVNDSSLVLRIVCDGRAVLIPGDIERVGISALLSAYRDDSDALRADVLVAPHHGDIEGDATPELLATVDPRAVVVSTAHDRSAYAALVHDTLGRGVPVYSTHATGAVLIDVAFGREVRIDTPFQRTSSDSPALQNPVELSNAEALHD